MKALFIAIALSLALASLPAAAEWYPRNAVNPAKSANTTARAVATHLNNVACKTNPECTRKWHPYSAEQSLSWLRGMTRICYMPDGPKKADDVWMVTEKPEPPAVCVWDKMSAGRRNLVTGLVGAPE